MANELRVRQLGLGGQVEVALTDVDVTLTSAALAAMVAIGSTQHLPIVLDPDGIWGAPEVAYVTAHTAGATTCTLVRGREGTTGRAHPVDTYWVHAPLPSDVDGAMPWTVQVPVLHSPIASVGTWGLAFDGSQIMSGLRQQTAPALNDSIDFPIPPLAPGVWRCELLTVTSNSRAIVTVQLDDGAGTFTTVGTMDSYSDGAVYNAALSIAGISIASVVPNRTVRFKAASKNASSSNYYMGLTSVQFRRTA